MSIERISTIQTASVITQPTDVVEHLTLIEKLEQLSDKYLNQYKYHGDNTDLNCSSAVDDAIAIVKQHGDWISVDERLPEPNKIVLVAIHYPQYYVPDFMYVTTADYDEVRKKWSSITNVAELKNVVYWQPFPKLPNPPSEVKDD